MVQVHEKLLRAVTAVRRRLVLEDGQALIEYALTLALISIVTIGVLQAVGLNVSSLLEKVSVHMSSVTNP